MKEIMQRKIAEMRWRYSRIEQLMEGFSQSANIIYKDKAENDDKLSKALEESQMLGFLALNEFNEIQKCRDALMDLIRKYAFLLSKEDQRDLLDQMNQVVKESEDSFTKFIAWMESIKEKA